MKLFKTTKQVLTITGNVHSLLDGLTSHTLDQPRNACLDYHGKIIVTFEQVWKSEDELLISIEFPFLARLTNHLERYLSLTGSRVSPTDYTAYCDIENSYAIRSDEFAIPLGAGQWIITRQQIPSTVSEHEFTRFRLSNHLPLQGVDYDREMLLNIGQDHVSFTKGCFLGQEFISKVHHKGTPPKKLVVKCLDECNSEEAARMTSVVIDPKSGKKMGFVFTKNG